MRKILRKDNISQHEFRVAKEDLICAKDFDGSASDIFKMVYSLEKEVRYFAEWESNSNKAMKLSREIEKAVHILENVAHEAREEAHKLKTEAEKILNEAKKQGLK